MKPHECNDIFQISLGDSFFFFLKVLFPSMHLMPKSLFYLLGPYILSLALSWPISLFNPNHFCTEYGGSFVVLGKCLVIYSKFWLSHSAKWHGLRARFKLGSIYLNMILCVRKSWNSCIDTVHQPLKKSVASALLRIPSHSSWFLMESVILVVDSKDTIECWVLNLAVHFPCYLEWRWEKNYNTN